MSEVYPVNKYEVLMGEYIFYGPSCMGMVLTSVKASLIVYKFDGIARSGQATLLSSDMA